MAHTERFTVAEVATLVHLVGRDAESYLLRGDLTPEVQEVIFKAFRAVEVMAGQNSVITRIPDCGVGLTVGGPVQGRHRAQ